MELDIVADQAPPDLGLAPKNGVCMKVLMRDFGGVRPQSPPRHDTTAPEEPFCARGSIRLSLLLYYELFTRTCLSGSSFISSLFLGFRVGSSLFGIPFVKPFLFVNLISFYEYVRCGLWASSGPFPLLAHYGLYKRGRDPPTNPSRHLKKERSDLPLKWLLKEGRGRSPIAVAAAATAAARIRAAAAAMTAATPSPGHGFFSTVIVTLPSSSLGDRSAVEIEGFGSVLLRRKDKKIVKLKTVLYVPKLAVNILSLGKIDDEGYNIRLDSRQL